MNNRVLTRMIKYLNNNADDGHQVALLLDVCYGNFLLCFQITRSYENQHTRLESHFLYSFGMSRVSTVTGTLMSDIVVVMHQHRETSPKDVTVQAFVLSITHA